MPFTTSLAQGLAGIVQDQTAQLRQKQDRERQDAERKAAQDRLFSQQEKLAQIKADAKNAFAAASPALQAAIEKGDFQTASQIAMRDPNDAKHWKSYWQTFGQKHYEAAYGPGVTKDKEAARQAEATKGYEERRKIAVADPIASKKASGGKGKAAAGTKAPSAASKKEQADYLKALKSRAKQLKEELDTTKAVIVEPDPNASWYSWNKTRKVPSQKHQQVKSMLDEVLAEINEIEQAPLRKGKAQAPAASPAPAPQTLLAPPIASAPVLIPNPVTLPPQKPKLMPAQPKVSKNAAAILKMFQEFK
jgi:hypothetical protein